jgi:hypothetical protein
MNDLLNTLENQTADALGSCAEGEPWPKALIEARHKGVVQLCDLIEHGALISAAQLERIRTIEKGGAAILRCMTETREKLREKLRFAARQKSFAKCVEAVLNLPRPSELIVA